MQSAARILLLLGAPLFVAMRPSEEPRFGDMRVHSARKCAVPVDTTPRHFIDGRLSDAMTAKAVPERDVLSVMVLCLSPVDYTVVRAGTHAPGLLTIAIWTSHGPSTQLRPLLGKINDAQRAHLATNGVYATTLSALSLDQISSEVNITLTATATRWHAVAEVSRPTSPRCAVFDGALDAPLPGPKGVVRCFDPS